MQGFNMGRYVPPEYEGQLSANQVSGTHALGNRARKAGHGILTVRFEMPFAVWCNTCPKPTIIGQGVRFNAEKRKVGKYYSTPIWSFRMKHVACGGWIEIRTDPQNTDYTVTEGGKRRDIGDDKVREGDFEIRTDEDRKRLQDDAFAALEVTINDRKQSETDRSRIEDLYVARDRNWDDPGTANKRLRKVFRADRKDLEKKVAATEQLKDKMSFGFDLLDESIDDQQCAANMGYGSQTSSDEQATIAKAASRGLFESQAGHMRFTNQNLAKQTPAEAAEQSLRYELRRNTRGNMDTFGTVRGLEDSTSFQVLKRKRMLKGDATPEQRLDKEGSGINNGGVKLLVNYESD